MTEVRRGLGYRPALDGLRAFAVACVIGAHYYGQPRGGFLGVDLFFVLSGFLITTLLLEEHERFGGISLGRFYARRALRLWPALYTLLIVLLGVIALGTLTGHHAGPPTGVGLKEVVYGATYTTNFGLVWDRLPAPDLQPLWSLAVEEQFYLVWPLLLVACLARRRLVRLMPALVMSAIAVIVITRVLLAPRHPGFLDAGSVTRFDSILVGCLASFAFRSKYAAQLVRIVSTPLVWIGALGVMCALVATANATAVYDGRTTLFCVAAAILLLSVLDSSRPPGRLLALAPFVFIGRISYALYLWHRPVLLWLDRAHVVGDLGEPAGTIVALVLTVCVATGSYYLVEQRFLRRKWKLARVASHDLSLAEAEHRASKL